MKFDTGAAFEDFLDTLPRRDEAAASAAASRQKQLTKPPGSLGRLEDIAVFLAAWQGPAIRARHIQVALFAGSHGVTRQGVSPYPAEVTGQMVANFNAGGAAINQLASAFDLSLSVHPLALDRPTGDISIEPAMSDADCLSALNEGAAAVDEKSDLLAVGEMGIGNTTVAAALCAGALGGGGLDWAGAGYRAGPGWHPAQGDDRRPGGPAPGAGSASGLANLSPVGRARAGGDCGARSVPPDATGFRSCWMALSPVRRWRRFSRGSPPSWIIAWRGTGPPSRRMAGCWNVSG